MIRIRILQSTIERLLYVVLLLVFLGQIALYLKLSVDDAKKFHILRSNQNTIICIVDLAFIGHPATKADVDSCIKRNL